MLTNRLHAHRWEFLILLLLFFIGLGWIYRQEIFLAPFAAEKISTSTDTQKITVIPALEDTGDFDALATRCAPNVHPHTLRALVTRESAHNPFAIGVVNGHLERQPKTWDEALATARELEQQGYNFSMGLTQVNLHNLQKYGESYDTIFDACRNLKTGAAILQECYGRALKVHPGNEQYALRAALSCYYSGNFTRGFEEEQNGTSYVSRIVTASASDSQIRIVPEINPVSGDPVIISARNKSGNRRNASSRETSAQEWAFFSDTSASAGTGVQLSPAVATPAAAMQNQTQWAHFADD